MAACLDALLITLFAVGVLLCLSAMDWIRRVTPRLLDRAERWVLRTLRR